MMRSAVFTGCCSAAISSRAAAEPDSNAAREDALNGAPVKVSESLCRHAKLLASPPKVLLNQVRSSLMNTQRNLKQELQ